MESEDSFKSNLTMVKELILDEEKLVTYVSLSKDLCIHINNSKKLLQTITQKMPEEHPHIKLNINYIISGITDDNKARTTVCAEDELEKLKLKFKTIFFEHVYSVSKGSSSTDHAAYLLLHKFDDFNLCAGSIKGTECNKRSAGEIGNLKNNNRQDLSNEKKEVVPQKKLKTESKIVSNLKNNQSNELANKTPDTEITNKVHSNIKSETVSPKKEANHNKQNNTKSNNKTQKGIVGFFNKSNGTNKKILKEPEIKEKVENTKVKEEKMEIEEVIHKQESDKDIKDEPASNTKNKTLKQIKKTSKVDKKRKRVLHVSDSDSDEENDPFLDKEVKNDSDDEIPATPTINHIQITSGIVNPKKRRKIVDKTYTNEEGYLLTKKEEVYESCSENEDEIVKQNVKEVKLERISPKDKKNGVKSTKKKISPPQKGKQATLAHFFKKKEQ